MQASLVRKTITFLAIIYTLTITIGALVTPIRLAGAPSFFDKIIHVVAHFGLVTIWVLWAVFQYKVQSIKVFKVSAPTILIRFFLLAVLYGITIEILQGGLTTYRTPDVQDVIANTTGAFLAVLVGFVFKNKLEGLKSRF